jgi:transposase
MQENITDDTPTEQLIASLEEALAERDVLLDEKEKLIIQRDVLLDKKEKLIAQRDALIEKLTNEILYLRRCQFGSSSEKFISEDAGQLAAAATDGVEVLPEEEQAKTGAIIDAHNRKKENPKKPVREALPAHLPRKVVTIEPQNIPQGAVRIGEEVTEKLEYIPGHVYVLQTIRPIYAKSGGQGIIVADLPSQVLPRSNAGASMLAQLLVSKYQDHLPFYRQLDIFKRQDIHLAASTVNGWFADSVDLLKPLYDALKKQVLSSDYIQIDESTIPVVDKDKPGATRKGYHWIVKSPVQNQLFFHYQEGSRAQYVVVELLRDFQGAVQSDGYGAYNIYENKKGVLLLGCMAHARRKFDQSLKDDPQRANFALTVIQSLYAIEREAQESNLTTAQVKALRQEKAYPILKDFERWLYDELGKALPKSLIGKAIAYTYNIYPRLARYVLDGRYDIDNNGAENGVRALALGRKNFLFCGNDQAAERTAVIYSLLGSCRLAGVNPNDWLTDVLKRLPDQSVLRLGELLPSNWQQHVKE